jgi:3-phytase
VPRTVEFLAVRPRFLKALRNTLILATAVTVWSGVAACNLQRVDSPQTQDEAADPAADPQPGPGTADPQPVDPGPGTQPDPQPDPLIPITLQPVGSALQGAGAADADDPAIWIHPQDRSRSLLFLSDKADGIFVFDLSGNALQHVDFGTRVNNIDVRSNVPWEGGTLHCVAGNLRDVGKLALLRIDPDWRPGRVMEILCDASSSGNTISADSYGFALYRRASDGALFVFDKSDGSRAVRQWRVTSTAGSVRTTLVRKFTDVKMARAEGFVADDSEGNVYFAEERGGIHCYRADPDDPVQTRTAFFAQGDGIEGDREGLALYTCPQGEGYLVLSSQGNSTFKVYRRDTYQLVRTFRASGATGTDGLDVTSASVPGFPAGFLVIHDEPGARYLVYDWADVAFGSVSACGH